MDFKFRPGAKVAGLIAGKKAAPGVLGVAPKGRPLGLAPPKGKPGVHPVISLTRPKGKPGVAGVVTGSGLKLS